MWGQKTCHRCLFGQNVREECSQRRMPERLQRVQGQCWDRRQVQHLDEQLGVWCPDCLETVHCRLPLLEVLPSASLWSQPRLENAGNTQNLESFEKGGCPNLKIPKLESKRRDQKIRSFLPCSWVQEH